MKQQWTFGTTKFHVVMGDVEVLDAKKDEIIEAINAAVTGDTEIPEIEGIEIVETYVGDSELESTHDIND